LGQGRASPRFDGIDYLRLDANALWALLALPLGWALARLAAYAGKAAKLTCGRMKTVPKAILCGIVLGLVAMALPEVLFSGQSGTWDLLSGWQAMGAGMLLATCVAKLALTQLCEETGWIGGEFFPLIFCGVAAGYAVAIITGGDPMLAVALSTGALVGAATRKWLLTTCVLALCFPPVSLPVVALAAFLGAKANAKHNG
jgi:H+/Cl- antiporter ClcA